MGLPPGRAFSIQRSYAICAAAARIQAIERRRALDPRRSLPLREGALGAERLEALLEGGQIRLLLAQPARAAPRRRRRRRTAPAGRRPSAAPCRARAGTPARPCTPGCRWRQVEMPPRSSLKRSGSPRVPSGKRITMLPASSAAEIEASGSSPAARPPRVTGMMPISLLREPGERAALRGSSRPPPRAGPGRAGGRETATSARRCRGGCCGWPRPAPGRSRGSRSAWRTLTPITTSRNGRTTSAKKRRWSDHRQKWR